MTLLLVSDPDARARLRAVAALRDSFEVATLGPGEDPVRAVRRLKPPLVLLAAPRARMSEALRTCHAIKTGAGTPPTVGVVDRWRRLGDPPRALRECLGDGYLGGKYAPADLLEFASRLRAGREAVMLFEPELGLVGAILGRNFP